MQNKNFQNSPGILNRDHLDIKVETIKFITEIPAFTTPSTTTIPILAKSQGQFFCVSGEDIIFDAINHNREIIHCIVEDHENDDMLELGFRKIEFRMVPEGGRCSYGERVRAIKYLEKLIRNNTKNIHVNSHGGDRRSGNCNNKGIDLANMIGDRLQLDRETVNCYLNYSRYLNDETLEFLAVEKAKKRFFEKAQIHKRELILQLMLSTNPASICQQVSSAMMEWHKSFVESGKISNSTGRDTVINNTVDENQNANIDSEEEPTDLPEKNKFELTIVPPTSTPTNNTSEDTKQTKLQIKESILILLQALHGDKDMETIHEITLHANDILQQILTEERQVANG